MIIVTNTDDNTEIGAFKTIGEVTDGYHSFAELYKYRMLYNAAFFNMLASIDAWTPEGSDNHQFDVHKSTHHSEGDECFGGGWFIVVATLPTGQITNHYPMDDWDLFKIPERERAAQWDGASPATVADRLERYLRGEK